MQKLYNSQTCAEAELFNMTSRIGRAVQAASGTTPAPGEPGRIVTGSIKQGIATGGAAEAALSALPWELVPSDVAVEVLVSTYH